MQNDYRERRNDVVYAEHKAALARGEKRVLRRTNTGELHSYPGDEIGFSPGRGQAQIRTWWGMGIVSAFLGLMFLGSTVLFLASFRQGTAPNGAHCLQLAWVVSGLGTPLAWQGTSTGPRSCARNAIHRNLEQDMSISDSPDRLRPPAASR